MLSDSLLTLHRGKVGLTKYTGKLDDAIKTVSLLSNNDFSTP